MKNIKGIAAFLFSVLLLTDNNFAQQDTLGNDVLELSLKELMNVVVTPNKFQQLAGNVTQKIDVINSKDIEFAVSGNNNLCEIIGTHPGTSVIVLSRNDANWGTYAGIGPKYSTFMLQGVPLDAFMDPMALDKNILDHIEVQRGPASVMYPSYLSQDFAGNQSPLAGTVNFILKEKIDEPKTMFQTSLGSYNTLNSQLLFQNNHENLNYFLGSTYEMSDYTDYGSPGSWLKMKNDPQYKNTRLYGGLTMFMGENDNQRFNLFAQGTWHNGDNGRVYQNFSNQYSLVNSGYEFDFSDDLILQSHLGVRFYDRAWQNSDYGSVDTLRSDEGVTQLIVPLDISMSWKHGNEDVLSAGIDFQNADYNTWIDPSSSYRQFGNKSTAKQYGVYVQEEWRPLPSITLRGGVRYAQINNNIELINGISPVQTKKTWKKFLWSAGVRYSVSNKMTFFCNSGSSFAVPSVKSLGGTVKAEFLGIPGQDGQIPNPDLHSENGISADVGVDFTAASRFNISIRLFHTVITDAIIENVVSQVPSQTKSLNAGSSRSTGGELELSQNINTYLSWFINATFMKSNITNKYEMDQNNVEIPFSPDYLINVGTSIETPFGLYIRPYLNYNSGFYDGTLKSIRAKYTPGLLFNTYVSQVLSSNSSYEIKLFSRLYNLTNNRYNLPWQFENTGFSVMLGINVVFR